MIHIKTPFYSAGEKYGWEGDKRGIGISLDEFKGEGKLQLLIGNSNTIWEVDKKEALDFIENNNSYYQAGNTKLGVLPIKMLTPCDNERFSMELIKKGLI
jgi:hypothetical protein